MFSKQEQYAKETIDRLYAFTDSDYTIYSQSGRQAKNDLENMVKLCKHTSCAGDEKLMSILDLISQYCNCNSEDSEEYRKEEDLLKSIVRATDKYIESTQQYLNDIKKRSSTIFSNASAAEKQDLSFKKKDLQYVALEASVDNRLNFAACLKMYFDSLMYGLLPAGPCPDSAASLSLGYTANESPLFTHEPISHDIPKDKTGPFYDGLRTLAETDPSFITRMLRDCDNGKVYVRLYNANAGFDPEYIEVEKVEAHFKWIIDQGGRCNWPGYIITALLNTGLYTDSDPKELFGAILGSKINETDLSDFCSFSNEKIRTPKMTIDEKILNGYLNCGLAIYASLLATKSNMVEDKGPYLNLIEATLEFVSCFALSTAEKSTRDGAMDLLKQHADIYLSRTTANNIRVQKRIKICNVINILHDTYYAKPNENPQPLIQDIYPQLFGKA